MVRPANDTLKSLARADVLDREISGINTERQPPTVDMLSWLGRATLDAIGEAGE